VERMAHDRDVDLRTAAQMLAIQRIAESTDVRGIYP
jgi:glutamate dehydrogenase/leucine dehydrogenase